VDQPIENLDLLSCKTVRPCKIKDGVGRAEKEGAWGPKGSKHSQVGAGDLGNKIREKLGRGGGKTKILKKGADAPRIGH